VVDLKGIIDQGSPGKVVEEYYHSNQTSRDYLGLSEIGHECKRCLWYKHHGYTPSLIDGRTLRLFKLGDNIEDQAVLDLRNAGYTITDQQKEVKFDHNGITLRGHVDGQITGLLESKKPHLWECKSANDKSFKNLLKCRSYKEWSAKYYAQVQVYALGLGLDNILVWVSNKNDSSLYTERIKLDREYAVTLLQDVFAAILMEDPPDRLCPSMSWYQSKWCDFSDVCWQSTLQPAPQAG